MGCADNLRMLLEPLRLYDFNDNTVISAENGAAGGGLDYLAELLKYTEREAQPLTSSDDGLKMWEAVLPHIAPSGTAARKRAIQALLTTTDSSFTPAALAKSLEACGLLVVVKEKGAGAIEINFPEVAGIPDGFERITATLDMLLPCHLFTEYRFNYITWALFEQKFASWEIFDSAALTWEAFELTWL